MQPFSIVSLALLIIFVAVSYRVAPREKAEHAHVHGAGQLALLGAIALFGVDYFTSYYYATGEMMSALHPYGLEHLGYIGVLIIGLANFAFGALYIYSLGVFHEGGGSYTASMRYLWPTLSLIVAVTLIQDYVLTVVVSTLSGADQLLSILGAYGANWYWHFIIGAVLVSVTWLMTIRGRGESATIVFTMIGVIALLTVTMAVGLFLAHWRGAPAFERDPAETARAAVPLGEALFHLLTASMKGMVALTGLEAVSNGIQFMVNEDTGLVQWGRRHWPRLRGLWDFYGGRIGIARLVQTSFLFYGGLTTLFLTYFSIRFQAFDGTDGRTLVGNLAFVGFGQISGGGLLFWVYQGLGVALLASASLTALQGIQSAEWRNVAMGEIPEGVVYRDPRGTFTRSVTATWVLAIVIELLVRGETTVAVPFYGVGVFMPLTVMALGIREHVKVSYRGRRRTLGLIGATFASVLGFVVFIGQIVGKWNEGGWVALLAFSLMSIAAHLVLISPFGYRAPEQIHRIVREKARMGGSMASIVEWQALRMQEYRHRLLFGFGLVRLFEVFGVRRPVSLAPPIPAGPYDESAHVDHPDAPSALTRYFEPRAAAAEAAEPAPVEPAPVEPPAAEPRSQEAGPDAPSGRPPEPDGGEPDRE